MVRLSAMNLVLRLTLVLALLLTGIGLGAARGTVRIDGRIVLCTGESIVSQGRPGEPDRRMHVCPDMALAMLAAVGRDQQRVAPLGTAATERVTPPDRSASTRPGHVTRARDPPVRV